MKRPAVWCAVAAVVALFACSSGNNASGSFPFTGPSCASIPTGCWDCVEQNCNGSCITSACADYFNCFCACAEGDQNCYAGCQPKIMNPACEQCAAGVSTQSCQQSCSSQCSTGGVGGGSGGMGGSSGFGSSSGGGQVCSTSNGACPITFCATQANGTCTSAYYEVGGQMFSCASCSDTQACLQEATNACLDAGPVVDTGTPDFGPGTDVGPVPDGPFFDGGSPTCHAVPCGTMGQSMEYCEVDDGEAGACTQAWYQVGSQVFDCTSCSAAGCQSAEQAASMACP